MKCIGKKFISISLMAVLILGLLNLSTAKVHADDAEVIRVGFFEMSRFQYYDEHGNPKGYNVDYLKLISNYTGWEYEFVDVKNFDNGLTMLENKEIDLIAPALLSEDRIKNFDYSSFALGTGYYAIVSQANDEEYDYDDFEFLEGKTISVPEGYPITEEFYKYMELKDFEMDIVKYTTPEEAVTAMLKGETDFSITSLMAVDDKYNVMSKFCTSLMYYLTWKGNYALLDELGKAMEYVQNTYAIELERMEEIYFPSYSIQEYSKEEKSFIENSDTIRLAYIQGRVPLSFKDSSSGELAGISRTVFDRISEITGLKFEYVPIAYGEISVDYLKENKIDLISGVEYNNANMNSQWIHMSAPYLSSRKVFVSKEDLKFSENSSLKVAIATGSMTLPKVITDRYPNFKFVTYDNIEECFEAVRKGDVDLLIHNQYNVDYMMSKPQYDNLIIVPTEGMDDELCLASVVYEDSALSEEEQLILINILDKAIIQLTSNEIDSIVVSDSLKYQYEYSVGDILYKYRHLLMLAAATLVIIIGTLVYIIMVNLKHSRKHRAEAVLMNIQKKRYQLLMDKSDDMIYEIGLEENSGVSSDSIKTVFGWSIPSRVEDLTYDTVMRVLHIHPDDVDKLYDEYGKNFAVKGIESDVAQIRTEDKEYLWCEISVVPLYDGQGNLISYVGKIKNIDESIKTLQEQEQKLTETAIQNENLEELLSNALMDNLTDVMKISMKSWKGVVYTVEDGKIIEKPLESDWDAIYNKMMTAMVSEDSKRLSNVAKKSVLEKAEIGEKFTYHYKSYYDTYKGIISDKCFYYTTTLSIVNINNEKALIVTNMDDTEIMAREQSYIQQKDEFLNKVIDSQKFLYNAIDDTYITALVINLKTGVLHNFSGNESGLIESRKLDVIWDEFCEKELFPNMGTEDVLEFKKKASMASLAKNDIDANIRVHFKAKLDAKTLDPSNEFNWFMFNFRILMDDNEKVSTAVIVCDTDNVYQEIDKYISREARLRQLRLSALIENNDEIVYDFNLIDKTCIITGNEQNTLGWNVGRTMDRISIEKIMNLWGVHPEDRFKIGDASQILFKKNTALVRNIRVQKSDGTFVWAKVTSVPIISDGKMISIMCRLCRINVEREEVTLPEAGLNTDSLTGLLNSKSLAELTERYLREYSAKSDALIIIDLDHFKTFNDTMDFKVGDSVIKDTARKLQIIFSNYDYIGRFTSDEFGVFVKNIPLSTLEDKLEWALDKLKDSYSQGGKIMQITASIGVAYSMVENAEYQELYHMADNAVYEAKKSGREKFVIKKYFG